MRQFVPMTDDMLENAGQLPGPLVPYQCVCPRRCWHRLGAEPDRSTALAALCRRRQQRVEAKPVRRSALDGQHIARLGAELLGHAGIELEDVLRRSGGRILRAGIAAARRHALLDADQFIV